MEISWAQFYSMEVLFLVIKEARLILCDYQLEKVWIVACNELNNSATFWRQINIFKFLIDHYWTCWCPNGPENGPAGIIGYILTWFDYKLDFTWLFSCFVIGCNMFWAHWEPLIERKPLFYDVKILSSVIFHENIVNIESKHNYESKVIETKQKIYLPNKYYRIRSTHNPISRWNLHALERPQAVQK